MAEQTKERSMTTDDETETEVRSQNTPAFTEYPIGAAKKNKTKILKILTLGYSLV